MSFNLYTIGHSSHKIEDLIVLLAEYSITAVADVRSHPYSKHNPQFNRESFKARLKENSIEYVFLGGELGARSKDPKHYREGKVQYGLIAKSAAFQNGLIRVQKGLKSYCIALMCAEKDPIDCHRAILVCRYLRGSEISIKHILEDGELEDNSLLEQRLMQLFNFSNQDLFADRVELIERAYDLQGERIAFSRNPPEQITGTNSTPKI